METKFDASLRHDLRCISDSTTSIQSEEVGGVSTVTPLAGTQQQTMWDSTDHATYSSYIIDDLPRCCLNGAYRHLVVVSEEIERPLSASALLLRLRDRSVRFVDEGGDRQDPWVLPRFVCCCTRRCRAQLSALSVSYYAQLTR